MNTVAVIGSTGQLGSDLAAVLRKMGTYNVIALSHADVEVTDPGQVRSVLTAVGPDIVVNCAAFVRVDDCEDHAEDAFRVNAMGALHIARSCAELHALCVYVSTDYVFEGQKGTPYTEEDCPYPINVYGISKAAGEHLVRQACSRWLIIRTASLFGAAGARGKGGNFVETILAKARAGETLRVVNDIRMNPTYATDAAAMLEGLLRRDVNGVVHLTNANSCTWYEFAREILKMAGVAAPLLPVRAADYPTRSRRPANSSLMSTRLREVAGYEPRPWTDALRTYLLEKDHLQA